MIQSLSSMKTHLDQELGNPAQITARHLKALGAMLGADSVRQLIDSVIKDDDALTEIAERSYTHTLGFRKIVFLDPGAQLKDGSTGYGYQLRLHIWEPGDDTGVPLVESMHEHSFNFVSHVLIGEMENQCYNIVQHDAEAQQKAEELLATLRCLQPDELRFANRHLETLEAIRLVPLGSGQAIRDGSSITEMPLAALAKLLNVSTDDLILRVVALQGRYQSVASGVGAGAYTHRLTEMVTLAPHKVLTLRAGDTYHHPHPFAHRLYIAAGQANATMIVTTPVSQTAKGGSFQRPTWVPADEVNYARRMYEPAELKSMLQSFARQLAEAPTSAAGRLFDVA